MRLLLAEEEASLSKAIVTILKKNNYTVDAAYDGIEALEYLETNEYDGVILDVMMPQMDGFTLGKKIREIAPGVPFVYITAKSLKEDMKLGYEIGADDYIIKPFDSELLILKIKAILSRCEGEAEEVKPRYIQIGRYLFDTELRTVSKDDRVIKLTPKEARLLELLYEYREHLLLRDKALTEIWGTNDYFTARSMDVYITKLRKYFKDDEKIKIDNIHGSGFRLIIEE